MLTARRPTQRWRAAARLNLRSTFEGVPASAWATSRKEGLRGVFNQKAAFKVKDPYLNDLLERQISGSSCDKSLANGDRPPAVAPLSPKSDVCWPGSKAAGLAMTTSSSKPRSNAAKGERGRTRRTRSSRHHLPRRAAHREQHRIKGSRRVNHAKKPDPQVLTIPLERMNLLETTMNSRP